MVTGTPRTPRADGRPEAAAPDPAQGATALESELRRLAGAVPDPELPVVTLEELGVLRRVQVLGPGQVEVELTPTYTGCPAIETMSTDIERVLHAHGIAEVTVRPVLSPPWSTDDISDEGRRKLQESGIAPPRSRRASGPSRPVQVPLGPTRTARASVTHHGTAQTAGADCAPVPAKFAGREEDPGSAAPGGNGTGTPETGAVRCPHCGSAHTELLSRFSSTACKALRRCLACREPFDHFKEV